MQHPQFLSIMRCNSQVIIVTVVSKSLQAEEEIIQTVVPLSLSFNSCILHSVRLILVICCSPKMFLTLTTSTILIGWLFVAIHLIMALVSISCICLYFFTYFTYLFFSHIFCVQFSQPKPPFCFECVLKFDQVLIQSISLI